MNAGPQPMPPERLIGFDGVSVRYYDGRHIVTALHDISLVLTPGQSVAILGTKGSGKSTLVRLLCNLEKPLVGRVLHHNMSVSWPIWARTGLIRTMTARDNIRFTAQLYGKSAPDIIRRVDDFVHLGEKMDVLLGDLPSSTMAKVMFATAVALDFDCYPIDDWLVTRDHEFRRKAEDALQALRQRSTLVLATSRTNFVRDYCDVAYVLHRGVLTHHDTIDEAIRYFRGCAASSEAAEDPEAAEAEY